MKKATQCKRRVVGVTKPQNGRLAWLLECGHRVGKRASVHVPVRTRCPFCEE